MDAVTARRYEEQTRSDPQTMSSPPSPSRLEALPQELLDIILTQVITSSDSFSRKDRDRLDVSEGLSCSRKIHDTNPLPLLLTSRRIHQSVLSLLARIPNEYHLTIDVIDETTLFPTFTFIPPYSPTTNLVAVTIRYKGLPRRPSRSGFHPTRTGSLGPALIAFPTLLEHFVAVGANLTGSSGRYYLGTTIRHVKRIRVDVLPPTDVPVERYGPAGMEIDAMAVQRVENAPFSGDTIMHPESVARFFVRWVRAIVQFSTVPGTPLYERGQHMMERINEFDVFLNGDFRARFDLQRQEEEVMVYGGARQRKSLRLQ